MQLSLTQKRDLLSTLDSLCECIAVTWKSIGNSDAIEQAHDQVDHFLAQLLCATPKPTNHFLQAVQNIRLGFHSLVELRQFEHVKIIYTEVNAIKSLIN